MPFSVKISLKTAKKWRKTAKKWRKIAKNAPKTEINAPKMTKKWVKSMINHRKITEKLELSADTA